MKIAIFIILAILFLAQKIYEEEEGFSDLWEYNYSTEEKIGIFMYLVPRIIIIGIAYLIIF